MIAHGKIPCSEVVQEDVTDYGGDVVTDHSDTLQTSTGFFGASKRSRPRLARRKTGEPFFRGNLSEDSEEETFASQEPSPPYLLRCAGVGKPLDLSQTEPLEEEETPKMSQIAMAITGPAARAEGPGSTGPAQIQSFGVPLPLSRAWNACPQNLGFSAPHSFTGNRAALPLGGGFGAPASLPLISISPPTIAGSSPTTPRFGTCFSAKAAKLASPPRPAFFAPPLPPPVLAQSHFSFLPRPSSPLQSASDLQRTRDQPLDSSLVQSYLEGSDYPEDILTVLSSETTDKGPRFGICDSFKKVSESDEDDVACIDGWTPSDNVSEDEDAVAHLESCAPRDTLSEDEDAVVCGESWTNLVPWTLLFSLQTEDGFWKFTSELGLVLNFNTTVLHNFLEEKGIRSLGTKGRECLLDLIATMLVLQFLRTRLEQSGMIFQSLMKLDNAFLSRNIPWAFENIKKASEWARKTERQYPSICQRLELGNDWESATKHLLGNSASN